MNDDSTLEYSDDHSLLFSSCTMMDHAIADAEQVLHSNTGDGHLPWTKHDAMFVIPGPFKESQCFYYNFREDECFSVTSDDILTDNDLWKYRVEVEAADRAEMQSFVDHNVFRLDFRRGEVNNIVDAIWIRRFKTVNGKRSIKSRLCGRGYLDKQKTKIDRHSSTASRLSHRIAVSQAIQHDLEMECIDISTAFLQGLKFSEITERAQQLGHEARQPRKVWLSPPANVWRHLREINGSMILVGDLDAGIFLLELLKAMYGLVDGPLMFQLALLEFLCDKLLMVRSLHDDNYLYISDGWSLIAVFVVHVDDILMCAVQWFMEYSQQMLEKRFGKLKRQVLPFTYLGVEHVRHSPIHIALYQKDYLAKLKAVPISTERKKNSDSLLGPSESTEFRSLLCSMLWLCLTRLDLISAVVCLQKEMVTPMILHIRELNNLLIRANKDTEMNGLHFHRLPFPLKAVGIGDAGHATKKTVYAQEGRFVLLMHDSSSAVPQNTEWIESSTASTLSGHGHPLFFSGKSASRVSHSTSHAESLVAVGTTQIAQLIANRMTEPFARHILGKTRIGPHDLMFIQNTGRTILPVDHVTDCMDVYELCTGTKGLSSDKTQRIVIMSLREDRLKGLIRHFMHWPTTIILADGLTKVGLFLQLLRFATTGFLGIRIKSDQFIRNRTSPRNVKNYCEQDIIDMKS
jgi:hypothetical protein